MALLAYPSTSVSSKPVAFFGALDMIIQQHGVTPITIAGLGSTPCHYPAESQVHKT